MNTERECWWEEWFETEEENKGIEKQVTNGYRDVVNSKEHNN